MKVEIGGNGTKPADKSKKDYKQRMTEKQTSDEALIELIGTFVTLAFEHLTGEGKYSDRIHSVYGKFNAGLEKYLSNNGYEVDPIAVVNTLCDMKVLMGHTVKGGFQIYKYDEERKKKWADNSKSAVGDAILKKMGL